MDKTIKQLSLGLFGSVAWLVCAVALPMNQGTTTHDGLSAKLGNLVITQAFADDDGAKSDDESKDEDKSEDKSKDESSVSYDFSAATLVCVSRTTVLTTLGLSSESEEGKSDDEAKSDESKSDDSAKSDDSSSDDSAKSDDESKDDDKSKDDESKDSSSEVTQTFIESLAGCTALTSGGTTNGVWVPDTAVDSAGSLDSAAVSAYFTQVASGSNSGQPADSSMESYREIRGQ